MAAPGCWKLEAGNWKLETELPALRTLILEAEQRRLRVRKPGGKRSPSF
jgi:hypothetical protein